MREIDLGSLGIPDLIDYFIEVCLIQEEALLDDQIDIYNNLYDTKERIVSDLQKRPGDQRTALMALYGHHNFQVLLNVAHATLAVAPQAARDLLLMIKSSGVVQSSDAGMALRRLASGDYVPI